MFMTGKCILQRIEAVYSLPKESCRLFIQDRRTNILFLVDIGSDMSCRQLPKTDSFRANSRQINVYVQKALYLYFHLKFPSTTKLSDPNQLVRPAHHIAIKGPLVVAKPLYFQIVKQNLSFKIYASGAFETLEVIASPLHIKFCQYS
ncbi:hypothetical protein CEXT_37371 [Caerostris extrusa]|uniref:Uncharacterized protein n=1 Tax=Caerostris extrusa TaxID=172846 RepID=A0AAV4RS30_CAEEX|nr:hypothetical protein CEXT_37371 [Caerostris extrusa]